MDETMLFLLIIIGLIAALVVAYIIYFIYRSRKPKEVGEEIPARYREDEFFYDEGMDEAFSKRVFTCEKCGEEISPYDEECPSCGSRLRPGVFECSNCGREVDPRDKECPHCGEILLPEPYVCPKCGNPVEADSTSCDRCRAKFWSPILLDEGSIKKRRRKIPQPEEEEVS